LTPGGVREGENVVEVPELLTGRFYHGYYYDYCYRPLYVFCGEHLLCSRLRMSNIDASADSVEELEPGPESSELIRQALFSESFWSPATVFHATPVVAEASPAPSRDPRRRKDFWYICSS
jgi:hypothetical protein